MAPVELPYEIWFQIASFLNGDEVWALGAISRLLLEIALDCRYHSVGIDINLFQRRDCARYFRHLHRNPGSAARVREVIFKPYNTNYRGSIVGYQALPPNRTKFSAFKRRLSDLFCDKTQLIKDVISGFHCVTSLCVTSSSAFDSPAFLTCMPLMTHALETFAGKLRSLILSSLPYHTLLALMPSSLTLPQLEHFCLRYPFKTSKCPNVFFLDILEHTVIPFLNRHRSTIQSIELNSLVKYDLAPVFMKIGPFPNLDTGRVSATGMKAGQTIRRFAETHSQTLRKLQIVFSFGSPGGWSFHHNFFQDVYTPLPVLESLTLSSLPDDMLLSGTALIAYVSQYASSLSWLVVERTLFSESDWATFYSVDWSPLRHLGIGIAIATPETFDIIATHFPNLVTLDLRVAYFCRRNVSNIDEGYQFCVEMGRRRYQSISLRYLTLNIASYQHRRAYKFCKTSVVEAFVTVLMVDDMSRKEYLSRGESVAVADADELARMCRPWDAPTSSPPTSPELLFPPPLQNRGTSHLFVN